MTVEQKHEALCRGNDVRKRRARFKVRLRDHSTRIEDVLMEPEWWLFSVPVHELLAWAPRIGPVKANKVLRRADVWPLRETGKLTANQRQRVLAEMNR